MDAQHRTPPSGWQKRPLTSVLFVVLLAAGLLLALNLSGRIAAGQRIHADRQRMAQEVEALKATRAALQRELAWVQSDTFVEEWARGPGKMARQGERLVVPLPAGAAPTPTPPPPPQEPAQIITWQVWWNLFFDQPPPEALGGW